MSTTTEIDAPANDAPKSKIVVKLVSDDQRMNFLPFYFGSKLFFAGENAIYDWMGALSPDYVGGFWDFYELDNGGFYMAPRHSDRMTVRVEGNGFEGKVSADAAGIIATAFALNQLSWAGHDSMTEAFHKLREFANEHAEWVEIRCALD
jgi:Antirestriction protein